VYSNLVWGHGGYGGGLLKRSIYGGMGHMQLTLDTACVYGGVWERVRVLYRGVVVYGWISEVYMGVMRG